MVAVTVRELTKVFDGGAVPANLELLEPATTTANGTVQLRYALREGIPGTGSMAEELGTN